MNLDDAIMGMSDESDGDIVSDTFVENER